MTTRIREAINIAASAEAIFDTTQDYERRLRWDPLLKSARLLDPGVAGLGSRARCVSRWGLTMTTRTIRFDRPKVVAVEMIRCSSMFRLFAGAWRFDPVTGGRCRVIFTYAYQLRTRAVPMGPLIRRTLRREIRRRLRGLRRHMERNPAGDAARR